MKGDQGGAATEIGEERLCVTCGESWPLDAEFFGRTNGGNRGFSARCLACIKERNWSRPLALILTRLPRAHSKPT